MHTTETLRLEHFRCGTGRPGDLTPLFPGFSDRDRVGIVAPEPLDGIRDSGYAVLAAVTAFYAMREGDLASGLVYADYCSISTRGRPHADAWGELDVWPASRWLETDGAPGSFLAAALGHGVTRLLWPVALALPRVPEDTFRSVIRYGKGAAGLDLHTAAPVEDLIRLGLGRLPGLDAATLSGFLADRPTPGANGWRTARFQPA